ncbi:MAG: hypothetical protein CL910_22360 [Deltaproteobacteria bacterium]|nr:hypothetical protein [Deltaproteobacteria bacterium]
MHLPSHSTSMRAASGARPWLLVMLLAVALGCAQGGENAVEEARALQEVGAHEEAEALLREVLDANPEDAEARYLLGLTLLQLGRPGEALYPLEVSSKSEEFGRQANLLLSSMLLQQKNFEAAIERTDLVLAEDPENENALVTRAHAALSIGKGEIALDSADRLIALNPELRGFHVVRADALARADRIDEAEALYDELVDEGYGELVERGMICVKRANFYKERREDEERSAKALHACAEAYLELPKVATEVVNAFDDLEKPEEALTILRKALEAHPEEVELRRILANRLIQEGELEEAEQLVLDFVDKTPSAGGWATLADIRRRTEDMAGALEAIDAALSIADEGPLREEYEFTRADLLVMSDRLDEADAALPELEDLYATIIRGHLALKRGEPGTALEFLEQAEAQWPDNPGVRQLAANAAFEIGDEQRAIDELREVVRQTREDTDAALNLALLYYVRGEYRQAVNFSRLHIATRGVTTPEGYLIQARSQLALGEEMDLKITLAELARKHDGRFAAVALAELVDLVGKQSGPEAAFAAFEQVKGEMDIDLSSPDSGLALRNLLELYARLGKHGEALGLVDGFIAKEPDRSDLQVARASVLLRSGRIDEAEGAFERSLELSPGNGHALAGKAYVLQKRGELEPARDLFDQAAEAEPEMPTYAYVGAQMSLFLGDRDDAKTRLGEIVKRFPHHAGASNDLAWLLAEGGESLDRAMRLARRAVRLDGRAEMHDTLGYVAAKRGELPAAELQFRIALKAKPDYATARFHLGQILAERGQPEEALEMLRLALETGPFPEADQTRAEIARLEAGGSPE